jgi:hypothetical protein
MEHVVKYRRQGLVDKKSVIYRLSVVASASKTKRPRAAVTAGGMAQEGLAPMQDKPSGAGHERATTTADQDDRDQRAVLQEVLQIYPEVLTLEELLRHFGAFNSGRDSIERAVRDLAAAGLLRPDTKPLVMPTRAAVRFDQLVDA